MLKRKTHFRWTTCSSRRRLSQTPRPECSEWGPPAGRARPSPTSARPRRRSSGTGGLEPWVASSRLRRSSSRLSPSLSPTTTSWWRNCKYWPAGAGGLCSAWKLGQKITSLLVLTLASGNWPWWWTHTYLLYCKGRVRKEIPQCVAMLFNYLPQWSFQLKNLIGFYHYGNENKEGN